MNKLRAFLPVLFGVAVSVGATWVSVWAMRGKISPNEEPYLIVGVSTVVYIVVNRSLSARRPKQPE